MNRYFVVLIWILILCILNTSYVSPTTTTTTTQSFEYIHTFTKHSDARFSTSTFTNMFEVKNDGTFSPVKEFGSMFMNKVSEISEKLFGQACPMNENPVRSVETILSDRIIAQEPANRAILDAFTAWNLDREMKNVEVKPLVLAFTGPTGVGKTETALSIGDALFKRRDRLQSGRNVPRGLLVLRGEDYSEENRVAEYRKDIRDRIVDHLDSCSGNVLVVFDEVQKVASGVLDTMSGVMDTGMLSRNVNGIVQTVRAASAVFILISDIGSESMIETLMNRHGDALVAREMISQKSIRSVVRTALDNQWERLRFGKMIERVVPFLPLTPTHISQVVRLKLNDLSISLQGRLWKRFTFSDEIPTYLSLRTFIQYEMHRHNEDSTRRHVYAKYGARSVVVGGPISLLKTLLSRKVQFRETLKDLPLIDTHVKLEWISHLSPTNYERVGDDGDNNNGPLQLSVCKVSDKSDCNVLWKGVLDE